MHIYRPYMFHLILNIFRYMNQLLNGIKFSVLNVPPDNVNLRLTWRVTKTARSYKMLDKCQQQKAYFPPVYNIAYSAL